VDLAADYRGALAAQGFSHDPAQQEIIDALQRVADDLAGSRTGLAQRWLARPHAAIKGLYVWGGVGRGKTWLMDLFYEALPESRKTRLHFHRFMQHVHAELGGLRQRDPLQVVARRMAREWRLLCLDEFNVTDIGDAMILARLLEALLQEGIVLVTTSNVPPDELYRDGIQRAGFLPAIDLLNSRLRVLQMGGGRDYRCEVLSQELVYHWPLGAAAEQAMLQEFLHVGGSEPLRDGCLEINGRAMAYRYLAEAAVWFDFEALCGPPRSQIDYIELARTQHTVFLSDVPAMGASRDDRTRRFIFLIDEFYDRRVKLVISAEAPPSRLYMGERLAFEFQRTASRLTEMQTGAYLGSPHRG